MSKTFKIEPDSNDKFRQHIYIRSVIIKVHTVISLNEVLI